MSGLKSRRSFLSLRGSSHRCDPVEFGCVYPGPVCIRLNTLYLWARLSGSRLHSPEHIVPLGAFRSLGFASLVGRCPTPRWWRCPQTPARELAPWTPRSLVIGASRFLFPFFLFSFNYFIPPQEKYQSKKLLMSSYTSPLVSTFVNESGTLPSKTVSDTVKLFSTSVYEEHPGIIAETPTFTSHIIW